jgi:exonuclease SbcD
MARLNKAGILVFVTAGNHDAASTITRNLTLPENVTLFSSKKPESIIFG